ncbi:MAG: hypothetical protein WCG15_00735 [Actinomycetes bacterium]|jgi:hypothetical protein
MTDLIDTNVPGYKKDPVTHAVINTNEADYLRYKEEVRRVVESKKVGAEIANIKDEIAEIKGMLGKLLQAVSNG